MKIDWQYLLALAAVATKRGAACAVGVQHKDTQTARI